MRAEYDSQADALSIILVDREGLSAEYADEIGAQCNVAIDAAGQPVAVEVLNPSRWLQEAISQIAVRYDLDIEALEVAARAALTVPDRAVKLEVAERAVTSA
jgi:uncharacterized protein YuzE